MEYLSRLPGNKAISRSWTGSVRSLHLFAKPVALSAAVWLAIEKVAQRDPPPESRALPRNAYCPPRADAQGPWSGSAQAKMPIPALLAWFDFRLVC